MDTLIIGLYAHSHYTHHCDVRSDQPNKPGPTESSAVHLVTEQDQTVDCTQTDVLNTRSARNELRCKKGISKEHATDQNTTLSKTFANNK